MSSFSNDYLYADPTLMQKDPKTGNRLSHDTVIDNMITFLIAGHETTSGLLSFLFYYLLKNPESYRKAQEEVDRVIGSESIRDHHVNELPYITACLRETLRLQPTAPAFTVSPHSEQGEIIGGKYHVKHGQGIVALLHSVQRDPAVYGEDAEEWRPERMLDEHFNKLPNGSWKPFGNGARGCIGRPFAWQEAMMLTAMLLQYFNFTMDDPSYDLQLKSTLTIKPKDFYMRAMLREGWTATRLEHSLSGSAKAAPPKSDQVLSTRPTISDGIPLTILYGSNSGTCEAFAQALAADAVVHGFSAHRIGTLDSAKQAMPSHEPVVIVAASYEGQPTDNAAHFYDWLSSLQEDEKVNCSFTVFGCGHSDWKRTFHRIPKSIDTMLEAHSGQRICECGFADAAKGDMMSAFQNWEDETLWPALRAKFGGSAVDPAYEATASAHSLEIAVSNKRASQLRADVSDGKVVATKVLTAAGQPEKRHIEIQLPTELSYRAGDYLAVLPLNPEKMVHRVMKR